MPPVAMTSVLGGMTGPAVAGQPPARLMSTAIKALNQNPHTEIASPENQAFTTPATGLAPAATIQQHLSNFLSRKGRPRIGIGLETDVPDNVLDVLQLPIGRMAISKRHGNAAGHHLVGGGRSGPQRMPRNAAAPQGSGRIADR